MSGSAIIEAMNAFIQHAHSLLGIHLTREQIRAFKVYEQELMAWNNRFNLTAIRDPEQIRIKHFLDSLTPLVVMREQAMYKAVDVGTGAGFPGLPIKIVCPTIELTLVESVGKKIEFCAHIVKLLGLEKVNLIHERVENIAHESVHRQEYDWALARAVASMSVLVEYLLPLVRVGGAMVAMKGESAAAEMQEAEFATHLLGGKLRVLRSFHLPGVQEERFLIVVDKIAATPEKYPRRVGIPTKRPLERKN